jgi:hypothetical protein
MLHGLKPLCPVPSQKAQPWSPFGALASKGSRMQKSYQHILSLRSLRDVFFNSLCSLMWLYLYISRITEYIFGLKVQLINFYGFSSNSRDDSLLLEESINWILLFKNEYATVVCKWCLASSCWISPWFLQVWGSIVSIVNKDSSYGSTMN